MRLDHLIIQGFPPFVDSGIHFPKKNNAQLAEVHILAGANGCGKTRLLSMILAHLGNPEELISRCIELSKRNVAVWEAVGFHFTHIVKTNVTATYSKATNRPSLESFSRLLKVPESLLADFADDGVKISQTSGGSPPWHTPASTKELAICYKGNSSITDAKVMAMQPVEMNELVKDLVFNKYGNESLNIGQSVVNLKMKAAMDLMGGSPNGKDIQLMNLMEQAISMVTGKTFSFRVESNPTVHLRVDWGEKKRMTLTQLPDGLRSIIGWVVGCCMKITHHLPDVENPFQSSFVLILDEPECHLHPAWQRKILPAIQKLFVNAQIIVATHSPLMISSVNEGYIHAMRFNENDEVVIEKAIPCSKGDSYIDVLQELMDVKELFDPETEALLEEFRNQRDQNMPFEELETLARNIADRGDYLAEMMGREMAKLRRKQNLGRAS